MNTNQSINQHTFNLKVTNLPSYPLTDVVTEEASDIHVLIPDDKLSATT
jgi:hypothetical protein